VATVTDTSVVITWFTGSATQVDQYGFPEPVATDTELQLGQFDVATLSVVPGTLKTVLQDDTQTPYHYAEVHGLEPGTAYAYVAMSNGQTAQQTSMQFPVGVGGSLDYPGAFETLTTPPGQYLFTLALSNDLQVPALAMFPGLRKTLGAGREFGALGGLVSGSGPTCFFLAADERHATDLAVALSGADVCRTVAKATGAAPGASLVTR